MLDVLCPEYLAEVKAFATTLGLADQLQGQLDYLANYSYDPAAPGSVEKKCILAKDFAPHSFAFAISRPDPAAENGWTVWFAGGLIYQGPDSPARGGAPSYTVSLAEGVGWFCHT